MQRSSFNRAVYAAVIAVLCVLLLQVDAGAGEPGPLQAVEPTKPVETTLVVDTTLAEPTTTQLPPPTTEPPTTAPPTTEPPTTLPATTLPPTTPPATTAAPTTVVGPVIGPTTPPPTTSSAPGGQPAKPGTPVAVGSGTAASAIGPTGAFKSAIRSLGSTATKAAQRMVLPAVRKLTHSQPVAATKQAVMFVTEELSELKPSRVAPFLWLALLALLVSCGAFLRLWWAPVDWPSTRSLAVGAHRRAGQQPRRAGWVGWSAPPARRSRGRSGWQPTLPSSNGPAAGGRPQRIGIDVARLRSLPPAGKPVFTGEDDPDDE